MQARDKIDPPPHSHSSDEIKKVMGNTTVTAQQLQVNRSCPTNDLSIKMTDAKENQWENRLFNQEVLIGCVPNSSGY
jgi:hypothetical protein